MDLILNPVIFSQKLGLVLVFEGTNTSLWIYVNLSHLFTRIYYMCLFIEGG